MNVNTSIIDVNRDIGDFFYNLKPARDAGVGLTEQTIDYIADVKGEPDWIRAFRKKAYEIFLSKPLPTHSAGEFSAMLSARPLPARVSNPARRHESHG